MKEEVEELYAEGVATHGGPEPCGVVREGTNTSEACGLKPLFVSGRHGPLVIEATLMG
jgi:hypothetical protein